MKAIILAAGKGSRISDSIAPIPKSLLEINGKPIIRSTVEMLLANNIQVAVCTGYRHQKIEKVLLELPVVYYNNPFYDLTNNIASLWFAREFLVGDDCLLLSADVVFNVDLLNKIIAADGGLVMVTDSSRVTDGDYFFYKAKDGSILKYGPDVPQDERDCEYVGIDKISRNCVSDFVTRLCNMIDVGQTQCYFEYVFFSYIGDKKMVLTTLDVAGCIWREIDRIDDYQKALMTFTNK